MVQVSAELCCPMNGSFGFPAVWQAFSPYRGWLALAWGPAYIQLAHHQTPCLMTPCSRSFQPWPPCCQTQTEPDALRRKKGPAEPRCQPSTLDEVPHLSRVEPQAGRNLHERLAVIMP